MTEPTLQSEKLEPCGNCSKDVFLTSDGKWLHNDAGTADRERCFLYATPRAPVVAPQETRCDVSATGQHRLVETYCKDCGQVFTPPAAPSPASSPVLPEQKPYAQEFAVGKTWLRYKPAAERIVARIADNDCLTCKHWQSDAVYAIAVELATAAATPTPVEQVMPKSVVKLLAAQCAAGEAKTLHTKITSLLDGVHCPKHGMRWEQCCLSEVSIEIHNKIMRLVNELIPVSAAGGDEDDRPSCWHCGVVLADAPKLRCEDCPAECDKEDCDAMGCAADSVGEEGK